ncbi:MAG: hypothetical protein Aureis2KO_24290 [Aureisphaera sp.]
MKNILVPVGSSESAVGTLQYAIDLAEKLGAYVYVLSVFQEFSKVGGLTKVNTIIKEDTENLLDEVLAKVDQKNVTVIAHPVKGGVLDTVERFNKHVEIDLMILSPRSNSINEELYLGNTTGKLVKDTDIPALIVPEGTSFIAPARMLMAFKSGNFPKKKMLEPIRSIIQQFDTKVQLLHVETPESDDDMLKVSGKLKKLADSYIKSTNVTTFQAVLEHFQSHNPDMICVVRRKRGFFKKLWEKNTVPKKQFYTTKPLLVLSVQ